MLIKAEITQDVLNLAGYSYNNCPVALALQNAGCVDVWVLSRSASFYFQNKLYQVDLPANVREFIDLWDCRIEGVGVFSFELELK